MQHQDEHKEMHGLLTYLKSLLADVIEITNLAMKPLPVILTVV